MSRMVSVCLCAVVAFVSVAGATLLGPVPVLAANGTLTMATPLQEAPDPSATMIVLLAPGAVVTIEGPPVDGFYPVSAEGFTGWMRGETMTLTKDVPPDDTAATPLAEDGAPEDGVAPIAQEASDDQLTAQELAPPAEELAPPADDTVTYVEEPAPETLAAEEPVVADDAAGADGVTQAPDVIADPNAAPADPIAAAPDPGVAPADANPAAPNPNAVADLNTAIDPNAAPADPQSAPPADDAVVTHPEPELISATVTQPPAPAGNVPAAADPAVTAPDATDPAAAPPADTAATSPADAATPLASPATEPVAPDTEPTSAPAPTPEPPLALDGPAYVLVDMPVRDGPGEHFGLVFTVPAGSSLLRTGQYQDGWISVQYKEVYGWAQAEQMSEPIEVAAEAPEAEPVTTKEPKPGSGVAFTTTDLSLRQGPSANEEPIVMVPAGSRVILTGVMEGEFQRVTYGDYVGWVSNVYLENPDDPAPNGQGKGKQKNYSRKQVVKYIYAAADRYGQSREDMLRVATCESNLDPYAVNPSGSYGLFQFIRSTWKSTPYGKDDIFDPEANAMAAGWMWKQGRKAEWVCQ